MSTFSYRAFGLNICSEIECRDLLPASGVPDVYVRLGRLPEQLDEATATGVLFQAKPGQLLLNVRHIARYLISSGNEIVVDIDPGADWGMVLLMLLGSAFGALLHQRKVLAMHGSAIVTRRGAVVFTGASGYGKSTLAGLFHQRGFPVLADDVCPINTDDFPLVLPANPFLMLWADAVNRLGIDERDLRQARSGLEKYILPVGDGFAQEATPLHAVYVLELSDADDCSLVPILGIQKLKALNLSTYRPLFIQSMNLDGDYFRQLGRFAGQAKVTIARRPGTGFRVEELADLLTADFGA
jgi:hypothetical protein